MCTVYLCWLREAASLSLPLVPSIFQGGKKIYCCNCFPLGANTAGHHLRQEVGAGQGLLPKLICPPV